MWFLTTNVCLAIFSLLLLHSKADPTVTIDSGELEGKIVKTEKGDCDAFFGVPFAAPPIGDLRWKKPQPPASWTGIRIAKESAPGCVQGNNDGSNPKHEGEDCLYLNVFVPSTKKSTDQLPVMVFIHGGAFAWGSAREYSADGTCKNLASRGVIVVIVQFRLAHYGFFSTGDNTAPGNYALWDKIEALRWVKRNIANFGGDPGKVTIFGESSGSGCVSYLTYTPVAEDLFQQAIMQSGSARAHWAQLHNSSVVGSENIITASGCKGDSIAVTACLRQLSTVELQKVVNKVPGRPGFPGALGNIDWVPRLDGDLFKQEEFKELSKKPTIIGVDSLETPVANVGDIPHAQQLLNSTLERLFPGNDRKARILKRLTQYEYIDSKGDKENETFVVQQVAKINANLAFHVFAAQEAVLKTAAGFPVWVYNFDFYCKDAFPPDYPFEKGATHNYELNFQFHGGHGGCDQNENKRIADYLNEMWTNFAKNGDPSPSGLNWPQFKTAVNANVMRIGANLNVEPLFYADVSRFWYMLVPSIEQDFGNSY